MSSRIILSTSAAARRATLLASTRAPVATSSITTRTFTRSSVRPLKETHSDDPDPNHFEKHKQDSVQKAKSGKGHWKPELASNSEESIKADRAAARGDGASTESREDHIRRLQERTKAAAEETTKSGTSMRDGL